MIIVAGSVHVDPQQRDEYLRSCISVMAQARKAPGCLDFALSPDPLEPDRINVYERWASDGDLERFRGDGPDPEQTGQIRDADVVEYRVA
ncbi:MAG: antibiotic biosynthesis monooxygenase [Actinomycetota bacterium]|nr:antibiotic biosynthesis monooxygenase [Actinomycetota bacterium]